jgi:hypothetical protein
VDAIEAAVATARPSDSDAVTPLAEVFQSGTAGGDILARKKDGGRLPDKFLWNLVVGQLSSLSGAGNVDTV